MIVNLYSALCKNASTALRVAVRCEEECLQYSDLKKMELNVSDGSQRWSGRWFQALEPATEKSAVMSWYVQLMAGSRSETLTTGNI